MECATIKELLSEYMDDTLDPNIRARLEDHLVTCKGCTEELTSLRALVQELHSLEPVEAPADFLDELHKRMEPRFQFSKILRMLFIPARIKIPLEFATVAVMAVLIFSFLHTQEAEKQFVDMSQGPPPVRFAKQHTEKPPQPNFKKDVYQAKPSLDDVTVMQPAEETESIVLALLVETDVPGEFYTPRAAIEAESRPEKEAKTIAKEGGVNEILSSVKHLIALNEGRVISVEYEKEAERPQSIYAEIPPEHYHAFSEELARIAPLQASPPTVSDKDQKVIRVRIRFISSH
jgi:hypothetical protein